MNYYDEETLELLLLDSSMAKVCLILFSYDLLLGVS